MKKVITLAALIMNSSLLYAVSIEDIDKGDAYHLTTSGITENKLVTVKRVNIQTNMVKIQFNNGTVDWVAADDLLSIHGNRNEKIGDAAAIAGMFACMWSENQKECNDNVRKMRARKTDTKYGGQ